MQKTFSIIKPDAVARNLIGKINSIIEGNDLKIIAQRMIHMSKEQAENFYAVHKERPFFNDLVNFMTSGPVVVQVLYGNDAVNKYREIMGATNYKNAEPGTIRAMFATAIQENCVHGSDSNENAEIEISQFFKNNEIFVR
jgi:nucleoside-diphosphate kinase